MTPERQEEIRELLGNFAFSPLSQQQHRAFVELWTDIAAAEARAVELMKGEE